MPTITAASIISEVRTLLQDSTSIRWTDAELLGWLNDGQRAICSVRPDASSVYRTVTLTAGTRQSIPADMTSVIKIVRNMGVDGNTPGNVIRKIPMDLLDSTRPDWHSASQVTSVQHFMLDPLMPRAYFVYPPSNGTGRVEMLGAVPPADATLVGVISVDDSYSVPLTHFVAAHAYMKDNDLIGNAERADKHMALYNSFMGSRAQGDGAVNSVRANVQG